MTLRGRLTVAFLSVVLGPVVLGAIFAGGMMSTASHDRSVDRLDLAASAVRTSVSALCHQLRAAAQAVAVTDPATRPNVAGDVVTQGLAAGVLITGATGDVEYQTPDAPPRPWLDCAGSISPDAMPWAISVRVELRDAAGTLLGTVSAAQIVDGTFVARLAAATGVEVTLLYGGDAPSAAYSTESDPQRTAVVRAATGSPDDAVAPADGGRLIRRVGPSPGQPLSLVLSVRDDGPRGRYVILVGAVVLGGLIAVLAAWRLARSTTRPLSELVHAADRVAAGDLTTRVPVRRYDEVGRLATAFNRMTRKTQAYVQALTASRDQLRGHVAILGDTLSSTHDLQRILAVILRTALVATSARAGVVLLLDPGTGALVTKVAEGLDQLQSTSADNPPPRTGPAGNAPLLPQVPLGSGVLGTVAATGEPQRGRADRDRPDWAPTEPRGHTYIAVPVSASHPAGDPSAGRAADGSPGQDTGDWPANVPPAVGVLALYDRTGPDEFDDRDLATLRTFASQAAVAVDNVRMHDEAQRLSLTDPLTGLWNYRHLKTSIHRAVEWAGRRGHVLTVLALDLDRFKEVNDTYGHAAGDAVLTEFARRIRAVVREVDSAFRQGGEEFVVLLPETDVRGGMIVAERLGAAIRNSPVLVQPHGDPAPDTAAVPVSVTVSIGIAGYPDHGTTAQQLLDAADDALYAAKAAGRDTYRVATTEAQVTDPPSAAGTLPPPTGTLPPPTGTLPPATGTQPTPTGAQPPATGTQPTPTGAQPPADDPPPVVAVAGPDPERGTGGPGGGCGGASSTAHPPRQTRGR